MTWVQLDDLFPEHPKTLNAGPLAKALYVDALCYASRHLTDGKLSKAIARRLARDYADYASSDELIQALLDAGLWDLEGETYLIHDYLDHQRSSEQVENERVAARERMAKRRGRSGEVRANTGRTSPEVQRQETEGDTETEERADARSSARELGELDGTDPVATVPAPDEVIDPPAPTPIRPRQARTPVKTLIPDDFDLTADRRTYATANGIAASRVASTWSAFVNHHEAHASRFADWDAAWRTWVGREPQFDRTRGSPSAAQNRRSASGSVI